MECFNYGMYTITPQESGEYSITLDVVAYPDGGPPGADVGAIFFQPTPCSQGVYIGVIAYTKDGTTEPGLTKYLSSDGEYHYYVHVHFSPTSTSQTVAFILQGFVCNPTTSDLIDPNYYSMAGLQLTD